MIYDKQKTLLANEQNGQNGKKVLEVIEEESHHPSELMNNLLFELLRDNANTEYGKKYNFANIKTIKDYQKNVPIITYEDIKDYITRMTEGEKNVLTVYPFDHFNATSGTVGLAKFVPMTQKQSAIYLKYNNANMYGVLETQINPDWKNGRAMSTSEGSYIKFKSGLTCGGASAKMCEYIKGGKEGLNSLLSTMFTSPVEATFSDNGADRVYLVARFAMMDKDLRGVITGFMSQLAHIFTYISKNYEVIINDIENGKINPNIKMPDDVRESVSKRLFPMHERAQELREIFKNGSNIFFVKKIWPKFCYICGIAGGTFSVYDDYITDRFIGEKVDRVYSGITASEGLWSVQIKKNTKSAIIAPTSAFMEFQPVEARDDFSQIKTLEELEVGKTYELVITNVNGFYRYRMSDAVTVTGFHNKTPLVEFAYRVNNTVDLDGEKTTEIAMKNAIDKAMNELNIKYFDFCVYPNSLHDKPRYVFFVEPVEENFSITDAELGKTITKYLYLENQVLWYHCVEYKTLDEPVAYFLQPSTFNLHRETKIMKGATASQIKPVKVIKDEETFKFFNALRYK